MSTDLVRLWAQRDEVVEQWRILQEEADRHSAQDDPVLRALAVPVEHRTPEQQQTIEEHWRRRTDLLEAIRRAERRVRVASGHGTPEDMRELE